MIKDIVLLFIWNFLRGIIYLLPSKLVSFLCDFAGTIFSYVYRSGYHAVQTEIKSLIKGKTKKEYRRIAIASFKLMMRNEEERLFFDKRERIMSIVEFQGLENLDAALRRGKGAILVLWHFGNYLLVIPALGYRGYPVFQISEKGSSKGGVERSGVIQRLLFNTRRKISDKMPAVILDNVGKEIYNVLHENKVLLCAVDGRLGSNMKSYNFQGREMLLSNGIFRIAIATGALLLPLYIIRKDGDKHKLIIGEPIKFSSPVEGVERSLYVFKDYFLAYPHHYATNLMFENLRSRKSSNNPLFTDYHSGKFLLRDEV